MKELDDLYDEEERLLHELDLIEEKIDDLMYEDWFYIPSQKNRVNQLREDWKRTLKELEVVQRCIVDKEDTEWRFCILNKCLNSGRRGLNEGT